MINRERLRTSIANNNQNELGHYLREIVAEIPLPVVIHNLQTAIASILTNNDNRQQIITQIAKYLPKLVGELLKNYCESNMIKLLINSGLAPGDNYYLREGELILEAKAIDKLENILPPDLSSYFIASRRRIKQQTRLIKDLETSLDLPFISNLVSIIKLRLVLLAPNKINHYLTEITQGIAHKTGVKIQKILAEELGQEYINEMLFQTEDVDYTNTWLIDVVSALGGANEIIFNSYSPEKFDLTPEGYKLLAKVYSPYWLFNLIDFPQHLDTLIYPFNNPFIYLYD